MGNILIINLKLCQLMFKVAIGHSNDPDSLEAIAEVVEQCLHSLAGEIPQAGLLFAAIDFEHSLILEQIYQQFPQLELIGGTTDGELSSTLGFQEDSLTLMLFCSDEIEIHAGIGEAISQSSTAAVQQAISQAKAKTNQDISLCLALADGLTSCGVAIVKILKQELGTNIPLFGGLTADRLNFQRTYQFCGKKVYTDAIAILPMLL